MAPKWQETDETTARSAHCLECDWALAGSYDIKTVMGTARVHARTYNHDVDIMTVVVHHVERLHWIRGGWRSKAAIHQVQRPDPAAVRTNLARVRTNKTPGVSRA